MTRLLRPFVLCYLAAAAGCGTSRESDRVDIPATGPITVAAVGDILLTRQIRIDEGTSLAAIRDLLDHASFALANLNMNLLGSEEQLSARAHVEPRWPFGDAATAATLKAMGLDAVSLANDHATDHGLEAVGSTARLLDKAGILHAGTGADLGAARAPLFAGNSRRIAVVAVTASSSPESRATPTRADIVGRPGSSPLRYSADITVDPETFEALRSSMAALGATVPPGPPGSQGPPNERELTMSGTPIKKGKGTSVRLVVDDTDRRAILDLVAQAHAQGAVVVLSIHAHEPFNGSEAPADFVRELAHDVIDAGALLVAGHGPHRLRGIELYKAGAILHSLGNFIFSGGSIDDRAVNVFDRGINLAEAAIGASGNSSPSPAAAQLQNDWWWQSIVAVATIDGGRVSKLALHPLDLGLDQAIEDRGLPRFATGDRRAAILEQLSRLSAPFGTAINPNGDVRIAP